MTYLPSGVQNVGQLFLHLIAKLSKAAKLKNRWRTFDVERVPAMVAGLAACHTNTEAKTYALSHDWFRREWNHTGYSKAFDRDGVALLQTTNRRYTRRVMQPL
jgi:hypothetical protein